MRGVLLALLGGLFAGDLSSERVAQKAWELPPMVTTLSLFENKKTAEACQQKNGLTAEAMRRILIDNARKKKSEKRGGQQRRIDWHNNIQAPAKATDDLLSHRRGADPVSGRRRRSRPARETAFLRRLFGGRSRRCHGPGPGDRLPNLELRQGLAANETRWRCEPLEVA